MATLKSAQRKTESRSNVMKALKKLYLRYYGNIVKALTALG